MNWIDVILIIPLLWGGYKGFSRGLIIEAAALIAFGLAIWAGIHFSDVISAAMKNFFGWDSEYLPLISFAIIFVGILILTFAVAKLAERAVRAASLGFLNKLAGAAFGALKFALLLSMLIFFLNAIEKNVQIVSNEIKETSLFYDPVGKIAPAIIPGLNESKLGSMIPSSDSVGVKVEVR